MSTLSDSTELSDSSELMVDGDATAAEGQLGSDNMLARTEMDGCSNLAGCSNGDGILSDNTKPLQVCSTPDKLNGAQFTRSGGNWQQQEPTNDRDAVGEHETLYTDAAVRIQSMHRGRAARRQRTIIAATILVQASRRRQLVQRCLAQRHSAARRIQASERGRRARAQVWASKISTDPSLEILITAAQNAEKERRVSSSRNLNFIDKIQRERSESEKRIVERNRSYVRNHAVAIIQRAVRRRLDNLVRAAIVIQRTVRNRSVHTTDDLLRQLGQQRQAASTIQRVHRGRKGRRIAAERDNRLREVHAAVSIQRVTRGKQVRRKVALVAQRNFRETAAVTIQRARRRQITRHVLSHRSSQIHTSNRARGPTPPQTTPKGSTLPAASKLFGPESVPDSVNLLSNEVATANEPADLWNEASMLHSLMSSGPRNSVIAACRTFLSSVGANSTHGGGSVEVGVQCKTCDEEMQYILPAQQYLRKSGVVVSSDEITRRVARILAHQVLQQEQQPQDPKDAVGYQPVGQKIRKLPRQRKGRRPAISRRVHAQAAVPQTAAHHNMMRRPRKPKVNRRKAKVAHFKSSAKEHVQSRTISSWVKETTKVQDTHISKQRRFAQQQRIVYTKLMRQQRILAEFSSKRKGQHYQSRAAIANATAEVERLSHELMALNAEYAAHVLDRIPSQAAAVTPRARIPSSRSSGVRTRHRGLKPVPPSTSIASTPGTSPIWSALPQQGGVDSIDVHRAKLRSDFSSVKRENARERHALKTHFGKLERWHTHI